MPSINYSNFNKITKDFKSLKNEYIEISELLDTKEFPYNVGDSEKLYTFKDTLEYFLINIDQLKNKIKGMLSSVSFNEDKYDEKYNNMLVELCIYKKQVQNGIEIITMYLK